MPDLLVVAGGITATLATVTSIGLAVRWIGKRARALDDFLHDWRGTVERDGVPARRGVMARLAAIESELRPNHGTSIKDVITRMEQRLDDHLRRHPEEN